MFCVIQASAQEVAIQAVPLGSGTPGQVVNESAAPMGNDIYHAPQYMPGYPTAAVIYPRVLDVDCSRDVKGRLKCDGYEWFPALGRGEYLLIRPRLKDAPPPVVPVIIYKEVPVKKTAE